MVERKLNTRQDFADLMLTILKPLKPYYSTGKARLNIGCTSAHYPDESAWMRDFPAHSGDWLLSGQGAEVMTHLKKYTEKGLYPAQTLRLRNTGENAGIMTRSWLRWPPLPLPFYLPVRKSGSH